MGNVLVTGFGPFSPLTYTFGNPSERVVRALTANRVSGIVLPVNAGCVTALNKTCQTAEISAVLMMGAELYAPHRAIVLELAGEDETGTAQYSSAAAALRLFARGLGVRADVPNLFTSGGWCLRSYGAALSWAEPRKIPCIFLHLNPLPYFLEHQTKIARQFLDRLRVGVSTSRAVPTPGRRR